MLDDPVEILEFLLDLPTSLAAKRSYAELLESVAQQGRRLLRAGRIEILTLDQTNRFLVPAASDPKPAGGTAEPIPLYAGAGRNTTNAAAHAAFTGKLVRLPDIYRFTGFDFEALHREDRLVRRRTRSFIAFPLRNHDAMTIGVVRGFDLDWGPEDAVVPPWLDRGVQAFASMAAVAMTNLKLMEDKQQLIRRLGRSNTSLETENARLRSQVVQVEALPDVIGESQAMREVYRLVARTLDSTVTVLLTGETGSGKEVMAQAIHRGGKRKSCPFIVQNCAALPEHLLESELFGHRRGAFTGAFESKPGLFQAADRGTLFLDEIGDMPLGLQGKLLRVLQDSEIRPIGETRSRKVDVRIIAATHKDLREKVRSGEFREDLYYRLCVFPIRVPPLRERRADILPLVEHFLGRAAIAHGRDKPLISAAAAELLERHRYPGNVRELKNAVERALLLLDGDGPIQCEHLPAELAGSAGTGEAPGETMLLGPIPPDGSDLRTILQRYETAVISTKLEDHGWNQTRAARELGISRRSLVEKILRYQIRRDSPGRR